MASSSPPSSTITTASSSPSPVIMIIVIASGASSSPQQDYHTQNSHRHNKHTNITISTPSLSPIIVKVTMILYYHHNRRHCDNNLTVRVAITSVHITVIIKRINNKEQCGAQSQASLAGSSTASPSSPVPPSSITIAATNALYQEPQQCHIVF